MKELKKKLKEKLKNIKTLFSLDMATIGRYEKEKNIFHTHHIFL